MKNSFAAVTIFCLLTLSSISFPQQIQKADWSAFKFLIGEWIGEGSGSTGEASGAFTFSYDLQTSILVRKNFADYPAQNGRPAFRHDDLMIMYQEHKSVKAIYFDNEGHIINYSVSFSKDSSTVIFVSEPTSNSQRFRFTYSKVEEKRMKFSFDFAPPGKPEEFTKYIDGFVRKTN
jgi:hypothetical protein